MFYDFWIENPDEETKKLLVKLGFSGACIFNAIAEDKELVLIKGKAVKNKSSENADFIVLENSDEKVQRAAIKNSSVDGIRAFVRYPAIREMAEKKIALVLCFSDLLNSNDLRKTIYLMRRSISLAKKYKTPIVIASGAKNKWELRAASELVAFGEVLGLDANTAKKALYSFQEKIIERTKLKKEGRYISSGVTVAKGGTAHARLVP
jgi:RNase P/RNase MRP subunit p30